VIHALGGRLKSGQKMIKKTSSEYWPNARKRLSYFQISRFARPLYSFPYMKKMVNTMSCLPEGRRSWNITKDRSASPADHITMKTAD
jgi:hypothetical protein